MFGSKKMLGSKLNFWSKFFFGKHALSFTNSFLVGSVIVDLGWVLLIVTWVNRTQAPKLSQKPMSSLYVYMEKYQFISCKIY